MTIHPFLSEKDFFDENFDAGTKKILDYFFCQEIVAEIKTYILHPGVNESCLLKLTSTLPLQMSSLPHHTPPLLISTICSLKVFKKLPIAYYKLDYLAQH